ncbi:MAG TPA: M23 family metallopeptidase [Methylotenera sp.]|nr:M23 family metallopeptidase [Methylotenera sp.]
MNIIFVSNKMAKAKTLSVFHLALIALALVVIPVLITLLFIVPQEAAAQKGGKSLIPSQLRFSFNNPQKHLDAYALQLGEMQARMMRLDSQAERLAKLAGEKPQEKSLEKSLEKPQDKPGSESAIQKKEDAQRVQDGRGGPLVLNSPMTEADLQKEIAVLLGQIEAGTDDLARIEAKLLQQSVLKDLLPNSSPVTAAYNSSSYGWRSDPFTGEKAFHEGLDFPAPTGTLIYAAAGGIVSTSEDTAGYGKLVKIEHGSGLETRYAHCSKLLVKAGERVEKGQVIAEMGNTGRSTGPHLHYEIRLNGNALDPRQYLKAGA